MVVTDLFAGVLVVGVCEHTTVQGTVSKLKIHNLLFGSGNHLFLHGGDGRQDAGKRYPEGEKFLCGVKCSFSHRVGTTLAFFFIFCYNLLVLGFREIVVAIV